MLNDKMALGNKMYMATKLVLSYIRVAGKESCNAMKTCMEPMISFVKRRRNMAVDSPLKDNEENDFIESPPTTADGSSPIAENLSYTQNKVETHCRWLGCDRELHTQERLIKVRSSRMVLHLLLPSM